MTFPIITYKYNGLEEAKTLAVSLEQKFTSLGRLITPGSSASCSVEFEKTAEHTHGRIFRVEVNLSVDGKLYRAEATENTFEESIAKVRDELDTELSKAKDKKDTLRKRAGRAFKSFLARG